MHLSRFNLDGAATLDNYTFANSPSHSPCALPLDVDPVAQRDIRPNLDGPVVAHECCVHIFSTTLLVEQGWSQLITLCPPELTLLREARTKA